MYTQLQLRDSTRPPVTLSTLDQMKREGEKIACLTCYDASFAVLVDAADVDVVLVGDSLGMVIQGHDTTVPVTMDDIVYHTGRGARTASPVPDRRPAVHELPDAGQALANAVRLMQEGGAKMVKLESGAGSSRSSSSWRGTTSRCARTWASSRSRCTRPAASACRAATDAAARRMLQNAKALESAGADIVLLECIPVRARQARSPRRSSAGDRHRRRPGHRRPDPGAVRHARHHPRPQAALRAQLHGGREGAISRRSRPTCRR